MRRSWRLALVGGWAAGLLVWENTRSLRRTRDEKWVRDTRNLAIAGLAGIVVAMFEAPVAGALARRAERHRCGLAQTLPLPSLLRPVAAIAMLDCTLYCWHFLTHRVPLLWRFHQVHHVDRELDASTALRFHAGEITLSVAFRAAQVRIIGPSPAAYAAWQTFLFCCILFHHANVRLPLAWERRVAAVVVTPRLHGIHHSVAAGEVNSNWSSGLTLWDWLFGTLRTGVPQASIAIGVEGLRDERHQQLEESLLLPFRSPVPVIAMPQGSSRERLIDLQN